MDTKILSLDDIQTQLRDVALDIREKGLEIELGTLKGGGLSDLHLRKLEHAFGCVLPDSFKRVVQEYDFSGLQIGDTSFGAVRGYCDELIWLNCETTWWCGSPWIFPETPRTSPRPEQLLMIATGDPYSWLLDVSNGRILALDAEKLHPDALPAARNFQQFVQCRASLWLAAVHSRPVEELRNEIVRMTGGDVRVWQV
jgi:hypothetical protein